MAVKPRGLWVVNKNYITESYMQHTWLEELYYEVILETDTGGYATRRNREKALVKREPNFTSWKIGVLFDDDDPTSKEIFSRLLEAGGASYIIKDDMESYNSHEFVEWVLVCGRSANQKKQVDELTEMGFTCIDIRFLTNTLLMRCVEPMDKYIFKTTDELSCKAHDNIFNRIISLKIKKRKKSVFELDTPCKKRERIAVTVIWKGERITLNETENCCHKGDNLFEVKKSVFGCDESLCDKWQCPSENKENCTNSTLYVGDSEHKASNLSGEQIMNYLIAQTRKNSEETESFMVKENINVPVNERSNYSSTDIYCSNDTYTNKSEVHWQSNTVSQKQNSDETCATNIVNKMQKIDCEWEEPYIQSRSLKFSAFDNKDKNLIYFTGVDKETLPDENFSVQLYQGIIKRHKPSVDEESGFHSLEGEEKDIQETVNEPVDTSVRKTYEEKFLSSDKGKNVCSETVDKSNLYEGSFCIPLNLNIERRPKLFEKKETKINSFIQEEKCGRTITKKCKVNCVSAPKDPTDDQSQIQNSVSNACTYSSKKLKEMRNGSCVNDNSSTTNDHLIKSNISVEGNSSVRLDTTNQACNSECEKIGECLTSDSNVSETKFPVPSTLSWHQLRKFHVLTSHEIATVVQKEIEAELDDPWKAFNVCGPPLCCKTSPSSFKTPSINVRNIFLAMIEQELWDAALNFFDLAVDTGILPDACAVQALFDLVLDEMLHPDGMISTLLDLLDDESSTENENNYNEVPVNELNSRRFKFKDLPKTTRFERIFILLDCINNVLASDLGRWMQRHYLSEDKVLWPERPLAESALRPWGEGVPLQNDIRLLFRVCLQLRHSSRFEWNELHSVLRLLHLAAEVFRLNDDTINAAFPEFGFKCQFFADQLLWQMEDFGLDTANCVQFLSCVVPSWVAMLVGKKLLENILGESIKYPLLTVTCLLKERFSYMKRKNQRKQKKHLKEGKCRINEEIADHVPDGSMLLQLTNSYKSALKYAPDDLRLILNGDSCLYDDKVFYTCWPLSSELWAEMSAILPVIANSCLQAYNLISIVSNYYTRRRSQHKIQTITPRNLGHNTATQYRMISYQFCEILYVVRKIKKYCMEEEFHVNDYENITILNATSQKCLY